MAISLDGFVCGPNNELDWENQDMAVGRELIPELLSTVNTMILGKNLYQGFEQAWPAMAKNPAMPKEIVEFAQWVENSRKIVFSKTLKKVAWTNSTIVSIQNDEDIIKEITKLKKELDGDMVLFGGAEFAQTLVRLGLVDEYRFKLQSVVLGKGKALFQDMQQRMNLNLVKAKGFDSGVVALYYQPK